MGSGASAATESQTRLRPQQAPAATQQARSPICVSAQPAVWGDTPHTYSAAPQPRHPAIVTTAAPSDGECRPADTIAAGQAATRGDSAHGRHGSGARVASERTGGSHHGNSARSRRVTAGSGDTVVVAPWPSAAKPRRQSTSSSEFDDDNAELLYRAHFGDGGTDAVPTGNTSGHHNDTRQNRSAEHAAPAGHRGAGKTPREGDVLRKFVTRTGDELTVFRADDGMVYAMDWDTQEWKLLTREQLDGGYYEEEQQRSGDTDASGNAEPLSKLEQQKRAAESNSRSGEFDHPKHGRFLTHMFQVKLNVLCFLDEQSGEWVRMPPAWELCVPAVQRLVQKIRRVLPAWQDEADILNWIRSLNYNTDNVINDYLAANAYGCMDLASLGKKPAGKQHDKEATGAMDAEQPEQPEEKPMETMARLVQGLQDNLEKRVSDLAAVSQESGRLKERINFLQLEVANARKEVDRLQEENINFRVETETLRHDGRSLGTQLTQARQRAEHAETQVSELRKAAWSPDQFMEQQQQLLLAASHTNINHRRQHSSAMSPESAEKLRRSTQAMHANTRSLRQVVVREFAGMTGLIQKAAIHLHTIQQRVVNFDAELDGMRTLYMREFLHRKQLFNQIQEMRGNIRVFCRCRHDDRGSNAVTFLGDGELQVTTAQGHVKTFEFEKVFQPNSQQAEVFEDTLPIITSCVDGYNVCLMAYGQTGAGKTYTMMGKDSDPGINIRALSQLIQICRDRAQVDYTLKVSMLEVYNERLIDLLCDTSDSVQPSKLVIQKKGKGICVPGLTEVKVTTVADVVELMEIGGQHRTVAMTAMNTSSSRSHLMLKLLVHGVDRVSKASTHGSLMLLDLAGSERISRSEATGKRLVEAAAINKSLSALGQACMFVNISPLGSNMAETLSTLQFGAAARQVALGEAKQNVS